MANDSTLTFTDIFGEKQPRHKVMSLIEKSPLYGEWKDFSADDRESILSFLEGSGGLQVLSDKFFQHVFRPEIYPERVESLISAILGQKVTIVQILSREGTAITETGSLVVMDIIVKTDTGEIVTVEMQRIGYYFPGERSDCYTADMIMRQYGMVRSEKGDSFSYKDLKPVTLIILMEKSSAEFTAVAPEYIHKKITHYSSGAKVTVLDNVTYVSLDTFKKQEHNIVDSTQDAWLSFFTFEKPDEIMKLVHAYPEFIPLYKDIAEFRKKPEEVIGMFSEALKIMDRNTTKYMIDDLTKQRDEAVARCDNAVAALQNSQRENDKKDKVIDEKDQLIAELQAKLAAKS
ncbi:MAG: PD-(D/E)XK nuclease family transposase [Lachnospiraceae bacterium]|nr:PD-(D/E)XK nuclease family transposase [Lachnospiraceae bacterium]